PFVGDAAAPEWTTTLDRLAPYRPAATVPGRGGVASGAEAALAALAEQRAFIEDLWALGARSCGGAETLAEVIARMDEGAPTAMKDAPLWRARLPYAAARMMDVAAGASIPKIWTPDRVRDAVAAAQEVFAP
ncbi:MAG: hypothetical protein AAFU55_12260, partial [Pseudomonadota bacterium]